MVQVYNYCNNLKYRFIRFLILTCLYLGQLRHLHNDDVEGKCGGFSHKLVSIADSHTGPTKSIRIKTTSS